MTPKLLAIAAATSTILLVHLVAAGEAPLPKWQEVERIVNKQLSKLPEYQSGDLISRGQVQPVFGELKRAGWIVSDQADILKQVPDDSDWFVQRLRSGSGRAFMRQIAKYPEAYDRVDRLSRMDMGHQNVDALIAGPDGYKMIQYMTTTRYGKNMGQMLSQDPGAGSFNSATGRIYTAKGLLARISDSYSKAQKSTGASPQ